MCFGAAATQPFSLPCRRWPSEGRASERRPWTRARARAAKLLVLDASPSSLGLVVGVVVLDWWRRAAAGARGDADPGAAPRRRRGSGAARSSATGVTVRCGSRRGDATSSWAGSDASAETTIERNELRLRETLSTS